MRYIRWQGAVVFITIMLTILAIAYVFAGPIAKSMIEKYGAEYTGAEVNVASVDVELMPFALQINELQATDAKKPSNNMVSFDSANASVDLWQLIFGRTIIESLEVNGLAFGEKRSTEGKVYLAPDESADGEQDAENPNWLDDVQQNLPDPKTLLDNSNLQTVKSANKLEQTYQQEKETLAQVKAQLPTEEKLKEYQDKVKALAKIKVKSLEDIEKIKTEFDQLKKQFKQEQAALKSAKEKLIAAKNNISADVTALKNAPEQDWQDISNKYQLSSIEAEDFAHILFGEKAREYYQWAAIVLEHVKPLLEKSGDGSTTPESIDVKGNGRFVHFDEENPMPSFWLKKANLSLKLADANYQVTLSDVTHQHWMINKRSLVEVNADDKEKVGALSAKAGFSLNALQALTADGDWSLTQYPLNDVVIKESKDFNLQLVHALLKVVGQFDVKEGQLNFNSDFALSNNDFTGSSDAKLAKVIIDTLTNTNSLSLTLLADGNWLSPKWQVNSELDNLLSNAFKSQVSAKLNDFKQELQSGLNAKMGDSLALGEGQLSELVDIEALLTNSDKAFSDLANNDVVKQQKKKLEDKAKDKLKEKLGKLFG